MVKTKQDLTGMQFGRLTVVSQAEDHIKKGGQHVARWNVFCSCNPDKIFIVWHQHLRYGHTQSCGCLQAEKSREVGKKQKNIPKIKNRKYNTYDLSGEYGIGYDSKGNEFYFDKEDYDKIKDHYWWVARDGYVFSRGSVRMHRLILGVTDPKINIDHIYHKTNDNRKSMLRICNHRDNMHNKKQSKRSMSGINGVSYLKKRNAWVVYIVVDGKSKYIGSFKTFIEAAQARLDAQKKYYGNFANNEYIEKIIKEYQEQKETS